MKERPCKKGRMHHWNDGIKLGSRCYICGKLRCICLVENGEWATAAKQFCPVHTNDRAKMVANWAGQIVDPAVVEASLKPLINLKLTRRQLFVLEKLLHEIGTEEDVRNAVIPSYSEQEEVAEIGSQINILTNDSG